MKEFKKKMSITKKEEGSIGKYFSDIAQIRQLSAAEEIKLSERIKNGDLDALEKLVTANLRFVVSVAKAYNGQGLTLDDRVAEGNIGLLKAALKFDGSRDVKFISFAVWWIRQAIVLAISEQKRIVRLPRNQVAILLEVLKAENHLEQAYGRPASVAELFEHTAISEGKIIQSFSNRGQTICLDAPVADREGLPMVEMMADHTFLSPDDVFEKSDLKKDISRALRYLPARKQQILELHFGINGFDEFTTKDIAARLGLCVQSVQMNRSQAIDTLRTIPELQYLREYL